MTSFQCCRCEISRNKLPNGIYGGLKTVSNNLGIVHKYKLGDKYAKELICTFSMLLLIPIFSKFPIVCINPPFDIY